MGRSWFGSEEKEVFAPGYKDAQDILSDKEPGLFSPVETTAQFKHKSQYAFYADSANGLVYMVDKKKSKLICRFTKELFGDNNALPIAINQYTNKSKGPLE